MEDKDFSPLGEITFDFDMATYLSGIPFDVLDQFTAPDAFVSWDDTFITGGAANE